MQKVKFDFEAEKQFIYAPNSTVPIGAPVDENGNIANDGNAIGIVLGYDNVNEKYWTKQMMIVMVGGYVDIIDAQTIWGDEYSAEAIAAMSDIVFCDNHKIGGGGGWPTDLPKPSVGGYGYTEQGEQTVITWDGDTTGKEVATIDGQPAMYKVSADLLTVSDIVGANVVLGVTSMTITEEYVEAFDDAVIALYVFSGKAGIYDSGVLGARLSVPEDGTYFYSADGLSVSALTYGTPDTIHKIDEKYLPEAGGGMMVVKATYNEDDESYTVDKTFGEIYNALPNVAVDSDGVLYKLEDYTDEVIDFGSTAFLIVEKAITSIYHDGFQIESNNIVTKFYGEINF